MTSFLRDPRIPRCLRCPRCGEMFDQPCIIAAMILIRHFPRSLRNRRILSREDCVITLRWLPSSPIRFESVVNGDLHSGCMTIWLLHACIIYLCTYIHAGILYAWEFLLFVPVWDYCRIWQKIMSALQNMRFHLGHWIPGSETSFQGSLLGRYER